MAAVYNNTDMVSRAFDALLSTRGPCVLFESTSGPSTLARRSLLARAPRSALVADAGGLREAGPAGLRTEGGIVADSDPGHEYEETLHKAEGMRLALEAVLGGAG